ncbi:MAG: O-Antigen ligase [Candidatus Methanofastidiosum methylothiophilum]|uniref:O-Antigen ligase n=1 Tax=Candidatus Methanofastidiosum methylothiophilum TaxID=1705564 RepID=A0A150IPK0_9EURY|nr:MAG: O-Antigen ligase [Candidatus Methanofastidiosum methylthiophilus]
MEKNLPLGNTHKKDSILLVYLFYVWTFVLIARPQDFMDGLKPIRPALSVGLIVVILYVFNYAFYKNRLIDNQQCRLYLYLLATMIISIPFASYRRGAFEFVFTKYIVIVIYFFLFYKIIDNTKKLQGLLWIACVGTSMYLLSALYLGEMNSGRLQFGEMLDPNDLAFFALSFLPFNILFLSKNNPWWNRLLFLVNIAVGILVILMTGSRGGFIALGIVLILLLFLKQRTVKISYKIIVAVIASMTVIYGGATIDFSRIKTISQIGEDYNVWDETGRLEVWKKGLEMMLNDPLTGVGVTCFSEAIGQKRKEQGLQELWQAPHSSLVQIGAETGIFGLILFLLISYKALKIFGNVKNRSNDVKMIKIGEMARISFVGHFVASLFLSQAYSLYWAFFIVLSAAMMRFSMEAVPIAATVKPTV